MSSSPPPEESALGQNPFVKNDLAWRRKSTEFSKTVSKEASPSVRAPAPVKPTSSPDKSAPSENGVIDSSVKRTMAAQTSTSTSPSRRAMGMTQTPPPVPPLPVKRDGSDPLMRPPRPLSPGPLSPKGPSVPHPIISSPDVSSRVASLAAQFSRPSSPPPAPTGSLSPMRSSGGLRSSGGSALRKSDRELTKHASSPAVPQQHVRHSSRDLKDSGGSAGGAAPKEHRPHRVLPQPVRLPAEPKQSVDYKQGKALVAQHFPTAAERSSQGQETRSNVDVSASGSKSAQGSAISARESSRIVAHELAERISSSPEAARRTPLRSTSAIDVKRVSKDAPRENDRIKLPEKDEHPKVKSPRDSHDKIAATSSRGSRTEDAKFLSPRERDEKGRPLQRAGTSPNSMALPEKIERPKLAPPLSPSKKEVKTPPLSRSLSVPSQTKLLAKPEKKDKTKRDKEDKEREKREKKEKKKEKKERKERERKEKKEKKSAHKSKDNARPPPFVRSPSADALTPSKLTPHRIGAPPSPHSQTSSTSDLKFEKTSVRITETPAVSNAQSRRDGSRSPRRIESNRVQSPRSSSRITRLDNSTKLALTGSMLTQSSSSSGKFDSDVIDQSPLSKSEKSTTRRSVSGAIYTLNPKSSTPVDKSQNDKKDKRTSLRSRIPGTGLKSFPSMEWSEKSENTSVSREDKDAPLVHGSRVDRGEEAAIMSGTLEELIAHLADENLPDWSFVRDFLVVYRYFTQAETLLNTLIDRFSKKAPTNWALTAAEWEGPIRLRVINLIKRWIAQHFYDFEVNPNVLLKVQVFIEKEVQPWNAKWADALRDLIKTKAANSVVQALGPSSPLPQVIVAMKRSGLVKDHSDKANNQYPRSFIGADAADWMVYVLKVQSRNAALDLGVKLYTSGQIESLRPNISSFVDGQEAYYRFVRNPSEVEYPVAPFPLYRRSHKALREFKTLELARQLTLIEFTTFERIQPREIKSQAWMKPNAEVNSPNVRRLTERFNKLSYLVASAILTCEGPLAVGPTIKKFISLAKHLRNLQNFQVLLAVLAGLNLSAVGRLKEAWKALKPKYQTLFTELCELCNPVNNHRALRQVMRSLPPSTPALPYLGLYLKDLTFIEDGNPDFTDQARTIVNFSKMRMISSIFVTIEKFQARPFIFQAVPAIQSFIATHPVIMSEEELYRISTVLFPPANSQLVAADTAETRSRIVRRALTMGE